MSWQTKGLIKKTPWRWIRDLFDDTVYIHTGRKLIKVNNQTWNENQTNTKPSQIKLPQPVMEEISIEMNPATPNAFINTRQIEDYAAVATENIQVIAVPTPYFIPIPIKTIKFKIIRSSYIIKIKIPRIKINLPALKRFALMMLIVTLCLTSFLTVFFFYRGMNLIDGDYIGQTYRMKMAEFDKQIVTTYEARVSHVEEELNAFKAFKDFQDFKSLTNYRAPQPKIINIYKYYKNKKEPIKQTILK